MRSTVKSISFKKKEYLNSSKKSPKDRNYADLGLLSSSSAVKLAFGLAALKFAKEDYGNNKEFYADFLAFNLAGAKSTKKYDKVNFADLPPQATAVISEVSKKFNSTEERFKALGTRPSNRNTYCAVEAKWAFEYYKKYNTWNYVAGRNVSIQELLRPLNSQLLTEYLRFF